MVKYLNYIYTELSKIKENEIVDILLPEILIYQKYWKKYSCDNSRNPFYKEIPDSYNTHHFILPTAENVSISWDIDKLYKLSENIFLNYLSLAEFETLIQHDLTASKDEFESISQEVNTINTHRYKPILVMHFKPTNNDILIDGRHRYIEYKKLKSSEKIPFYHLDDEMCITSILTKRELLTYIILHNIEIINNYITGQGTLKKIINIKNCMEK